MELELEIFLAELVYLELVALRSMTAMEVLVLLGSVAFPALAETAVMAGFSLAEKQRPEAGLVASEASVVKAR